MGKLSRRKGAGWERELVHILRKLWPGAKRGLGQARSGGEVCDVDGTPFWVEAKVGAKTNLKAAVKQAEAATDGRPVIAVCKDNARPGATPDVWVAMRLGTFHDLVEKSTYFVSCPGPNAVQDTVKDCGRWHPGLADGCCSLDCEKEECAHERPCDGSCHKLTEHDRG